MTKTLCAIILAAFACGCVTAISALEKAVSATEDARDAALYKAVVSK